VHSLTRIIERRPAEADEKEGRRQRRGERRGGERAA
jgi:hypothetical protein